jgi:hypothetical protein
MTGWGHVVLVTVICAADLVMLRLIRRAVQRRHAETRCTCAHVLDELDQRPEFDPAPQDWPLRESPPRKLERTR